MVFSEVVAQDNWIEDQVEAALTATSEELKWLKDLVKVGENLKLGEKQITTEHVVNVLKDTKGKSRHDIYETWQGAGVTLAVQYALEKMNYNPWTIDGLMWAKTKAAVKKFQEDWNGQHTDDKITADGFAGEKTIDRMLRVSARQVATNQPFTVRLPRTPNPQAPQAQQTPETETPEVQPSSNNIFDKNNENVKTAIKVMTDDAFITIIPVYQSDGVIVFSAIGKNTQDIYRVKYNIANKKISYDDVWNNPTPERIRKMTKAISDEMSIPSSNVEDIYNDKYTTFQKLIDWYNNYYRAHQNEPSFHQEHDETRKNRIIATYWPGLVDKIGPSDARDVLEWLNSNPNTGKRFLERWKIVTTKWWNPTLKDFVVFEQFRPANKSWKEII